MAQKVIFAEVFSEQSLPFIQAVYDTAFDWLADFPSILVDEPHTVEEISSMPDSFRVETEAPKPVTITASALRKPDGSYSLWVNAIFTDQYYDLLGPAAEELAEIARYDYDHRAVHRTMETDLLIGFASKIPPGQPYSDRYLIEGKKVWVVPRFDTSDHDPKYSVEFEFHFKVVDITAEPG